MRAPFVIALILAASLSIAPALAISQTRAVPAYKAGALVDFFLESDRSICIGDAAACPRRDPASVFVLVNFAFDSDRLSKAARENLDQFAAALQDPRLRGRKFEIDGYADATGTDPYNLDLSERRAAAVVAYLASKGLDRPYQLIAKGRGASKTEGAGPVSPGDRRVEARMFGAVR